MAGLAFYSFIYVDKRQLTWGPGDRVWGVGTGGSNASQESVAKNDI